MPSRLLHLSLAFAVGLLACAVGLLACATAAYGQDAVFSQYAANALYNNPGMAGLYEGELRITASYRDQWRSTTGHHPLRTYGATGELRYDVGGRDFLTVSANVLRDESGEARFRYSGGGLGLGMQKLLSGGRGRNANYLGFGGRVGFGQHTIDPSSLWFSSQLDTSTLAIAPERRDGVAPGRAYLDMSAGVNYAVVRRKYSYTVGVGGHHLNWPNTSLLFQNNKRLEPRLTAMASAEFLMDGGLRLMPSAMGDFQGRSRRITAGSGLYYRSEQRGDAGFRFGTYARLTNGTEADAVLEAIIFQAQVEINELTVGVSYDVNTGAIGRTVDARGAYELSLSWVKAKKSRYRVACPKL